MVGQDSMPGPLIGAGSISGMPNPSDVLLRLARYICWFPVRKLLNAKVNPSGEMLAQPSIESELTSVEHPGSASMLTGVDQSPKDGMAKAVAAASAAPVAPSSAFIVPLLIISLAQVPLTERT
jgi:hypothetical protein